MSLVVTYLDRANRKKKAYLTAKEQPAFWRRQRQGEVSVIEAHAVKRKPKKRKRQ